MKDEESSQSAELNSYHCDINPSFSTGLGGFVIAHQSALAHQPAEGAFDYPTMWQDGEASGIVGTFDYLDGQFGAEAPDPLGEGFTGVAPIHPQDTQPGEPAQHPAQDPLCSVAFGGAGRGHGDAEHQSQSIHQQMPLAGVIADLTAVTSGFDTLTVQNGRRGSAPLAVSFSDECAQRVVEHGPVMVTDPLPKNMVDRFPMGEIRGQITPGTPTLDEIQDSIEDAPPINRWAATFGRNGEHRFEVSPLGVSQVGVVDGDFHRLTGATANGSHPNRQSNQAFCASFWRSRGSYTYRFSFFRRTLRLV